MSDTSQIVKKFNVVANTEFNLRRKPLGDEFEKLMYSFNSGLVESTRFPFFGFLSQMEEFDGERKYQTFPKGNDFQIKNKEWDKGWRIPQVDFERASNQKNNALGSLNPFKDRIGDLGAIARDQPRELVLDMIINGANTTLGTCFDSEALYSSSHDYGVVPGSQANTFSGSGTTVANIDSDINTAFSLFQGFTYQQEDNASVRELNAMNGNELSTKMFILTPTQLAGKFRKLKNQRFFSDSDNVSSELFDFRAKAQLNTLGNNDYFIFLLDETTRRPFIKSMEKPVELSTPLMTDDSVKNNRMLEYGIYGRWNVAYGAWWKTIRVTNA